MPSCAGTATTTRSSDGSRPGRDLAGGTPVPGVPAAMSIGRHTGYNLAGATVPLLFSLVTIPVYIGLIGEARYGILAVAFLLLGYFGLFDLGLGTATAQRISAMPEADARGRATTFWTALAMNLGLGVAGGILLWPVAVLFFGRIFEVDSGLRVELDAALPWLILALPLATVSGVLTGGLQGRSRFLELNLVSVLTSFLTQAVPLAVAWMAGPDLALLLPAIVSTRVVAIAILMALCRRHVFGGQPREFSRSQARSLLHFGGWVTVTAMVAPLMTMLDRFVIGATLGARAVTYYTVPFQLVEKSLVVPAALTSALFPTLSARGPESARPLSLTAMRALVALMTPLILCGVLLVEPFLALWMGEEFAVQAALPAEILLLGFWVNALARVAYVTLLAAGRPGIIARCQLAELVPYLIGLWLGLRYWGLPGAAVVFGLRTAVDCGLLMHFAGTLRAGARSLVVPCLVLLAGLCVAVLATVGQPGYWVAAAGLLLLTAWHVWATSPAELRAVIATASQVFGR